MDDCIPVRAVFDGSISLNSPQQRGKQDEHSMPLKVYIVFHFNDLALTNACG
jgi:hypothetical protein